MNRAKRATAATMVVLAFLGQWIGSILAGQYLSWTLGLPASIGALGAFGVFAASTMLGAAADRWGRR